MKSKEKDNVAKGVKEVKVDQIVPLTVEDLRTILGEQITLLRANKTTASAANAVTNAAGKIFASIKLELEVCKLLGVPPKMKMFQVEKKLGEPK